MMEDADIFDLDDVNERAFQCLRREMFEERVRVEVGRLRREQNKSLWQRLIDKLPFTIVWRKS